MPSSNQPATMNVAVPARPAGKMIDIGIALAIVIAIYALHAVMGFPTLQTASGDNDSLLRLVEVHDLIAGQGWFDLHQYRMGPEGGFVMHWSRLVDAPLAVIILTATAVTGSAATGDMVALIVWPLLLMVVALFLIMRATRSLAGEASLFPAAAIGAVSLRFMGIFNPGAIDHHNIQLVLALAVMALLLEAGHNSAKAFAAGVCAALMLAIGMETAPYVAVAGMAVSLGFLVGGDRAARIAAGFGSALCLSSSAVFFATVPAGAWTAAHCDAFSITQFVLAASAGAGLTLVASLSVCGRSFVSRLVSLALLGAACATAAVALFPHCLADPYAMVDPLLRTYWLDAVTEAQPFWKILENKPVMAATYYATPFLALGLMVLRFRGHGLRRADLIVAGFLGAAVLVSLWQVRGAMFSIPFAVMPLAAWVTERRAAASGKAPLSATLTMLLAWLLSFSVTWTVAAAGLSGMLERGAADADPREEMALAACQRPQDYRELASLPPNRVLAGSNLGSPILRYSAHHVLAGPYHRNNDGNLLVLRALMQPPAEAEAIVRAQSIAFVVICRGNAESKALAEWAPKGLMADLMRGRMPGWLDVVPSTQDQPLTIYRVVTK